MSIKHVGVLGNGNKITVEIYDETKTMERIFKNNDVGYFMAETCARYMNEFVPMDTGMLSQNYTTIPWFITYEQHYAHYQFNGKGFNFQKSKHPKATSHWDKACKSAYGDKIAKEVEAYIGKR